jgi:peptidoglycan/LPS O-acetylase OafA/YrhL
LKTYYPTINLLRGVAAFLVCLFHFIGYSDIREDLFSSSSWISTIGSLGANGVYIFFVISGFVIPLSLSKDNFKLTQLHRFLSKRFIRIEIPYLVSILLILLVGLVFALKNNTHYTINIEQFIYHVLYLIPFSTFEWYNIIYWTLAIEFQFYIVIGLLFYLLSSEKKVAILIGIMIFGASSFIGQDNRFVFHYSTIFLQGIILFLIKTKRIHSTKGAFFIGICILTTAYLHSIEISIFSALTLIAINYLEIDNKITNRFGEISYSLYLTHGLIGGNILYLFSRYLTSYPGKIILVILSLCASLVFSYLYWWLIERPSRKLSRKINVNTKHIEYLIIDEENK